jgi:hypothetical protein
MAQSLKYPTTQDFIQKTLGASFLAGASVATLNNVTAIQNKPGVFIVDRVDANGVETPTKREVCTYTATSGVTVTGVVKNADGGGTDQDHAVGAIVEFGPDILWAQAIIDGLTQVVDPTTGLLDTTKVADLTTSQILTNKTFTTPTINGVVAGTSWASDKAPISLYAVDSGTANTYAVTLSPIPAAYTAGMVVRFKATNANTTSSTLNVNALGAKTINKLDGATALVANDIKAGQLVTCVYDGTNFQIQSQLGTAVTVPTDGWTADTNTWTYSSVDGHTSVVTVNADLTGVIQAGDRIKFTNNSTTFYGIVSITPTYSAPNTTITIYGGTTYAVANSTITAPSYSHQKSPFGFNTDPTIWTERVTDSTDRSQASAVASTWYNLGTTAEQITIPIGKWDVFYQAAAHMSTSGQVYVTLSTANNTQSDSDLSSSLIIEAAAFGGGMLYKRKTITNAAKTTHYLNTMTSSGSTPTIYNRNSSANGAILIIEARCAYL